jgi:hypothetical protein
MFAAELYQSGEYVVEVKEYLVVAGALPVVEPRHNSEDVVGCE